MVPKDGSKDQATRSSAGASWTIGRGVGFLLAAVGLTILSVLGGTCLARWLRDTNTQPTDDTPQPALFRTWPANKPELAFMLSAQMHGYVLPCGCSEPQLGGLERRSNFLDELRSRGWPVVALDLGDIPQKHGPVSLPNIEGLIKYRYSMRALKAMGYAAVSIGEYEAALGLLDALAEWAIQDNEKSPRFLAANLSEPKGFDDFVGSWHYLAKAGGSDLSVGVTALVGPSVVAQIKDPGVSFAPSAPILAGVMKEMDARKVDLRVVLYHGSMVQIPQGMKIPEALALAEAFPQLDLILCLSESDEPAGTPTIVKHANGRQTMVVSLGHKGKYVGVVGVFPTGNNTAPLGLRYELVQMSPNFATPQDKVNGHKIIELMEAYTAELKKGDYLKRVTQTRHLMQVQMPDPAPTYVGSDKCQKCHKSAFKVWQNSAHSKAYQSLANAKLPSLRQFDPECVVCHTVGFGYQGGFVDAEQTPKLKDVGCESCHGPASGHVKDWNNTAWYPLLNPWKAPANEAPADKEKRLLRIDLFCQKCHDIDNDVTWAHGGFSKKWPKIAHPD
jgi:Cytochrome c554 and c-prime